MNNSYKFILIYFLVLIPIGLLFGAFESYPTSTANLAFGRINMNCNGNVIDIINEPSSIIHFNMRGGEVIWNRPFQINELQHTAFTSAFIYKNLGFGVSASTFGNNIYSESMLVLSVAKSMKARLLLGVNIILYQLKITDYGIAHAPGLSVSMRYTINDYWDWVTTVRNINSPIKQLLFSVGYVSNPGQLTAGFSININKIYFEYGTIAYNDLGLFTHQLGIGVNLDRH